MWDYSLAKRLDFTFQNDDCDLVPVDMRARNPLRPLLRKHGSGASAGIRSVSWKISDARYIRLRVFGRSAVENTESAETGQMRLL